MSCAPVPSRVCLYKNSSLPEKPVAICWAERVCRHTGISPLPSAKSETPAHVDTAMGTMKVAFLVTVDSILLLLLVTTMMIVPVSGDNSAWLTENPEMDTSNESTRNIILDLHNTIRRNVVPTASNMLKMVWSNKAAESSRKWVATCAYEHRTEAELNLQGFECGENIFESPTLQAWNAAIDVWRSENGNTDFEFGVGPRLPGVVGHYLQVVSYNSYEVGCAVNYCPTDDVYNYFYTCMYCPGGNLNYRLMTPYDAGETCSACPGACDNGLCTNPCLKQNFYMNCDEMKKVYGCGNDEMGTMVQETCPASCFCPDKIY